MSIPAMDVLLHRVLANQTIYNWLGLRTTYVLGSYEYNACWAGYLSPSAEDEVTVNADTIDASDFNDLERSFVSFMRVQSQTHNSGIPHFAF